MISYFPRLILPSPHLFSWFKAMNLLLHIVSIGKFTLHLSALGSSPFLIPLFFSNFVLISLLQYHYYHPIPITYWQCSTLALLFSLSYPHKHHPFPLFIHPINPNLYSQHHFSSLHLLFTLLHFIMLPVHLLSFVDR